MKVLLISALTIVCSAAFADEPAKENPIVTTPPAPANFCAQPQMLRWFYDSEIGRQLQLRQQAAIAQAVAEHENLARQK